MPTVIVLSVKSGGHGQPGLRLMYWPDLEILLQVGYPDHLKCEIVITSTFHCVAYINYGALYMIEPQPIRRQILFKLHAI